MSRIKDEALAYAREIGLDLAGVTTPEPFDRYLAELDAREEHYRERYAYRLETWRRFARPREALPGAASVLVIAFGYLASDGPPPAEPCGTLGRIVATGHLGILKRARLMTRFLKRKGYRAVMGAHRKEAAVRAGLGMVGKNNLVANRALGGWVAYQTIVTDAAMEPDAPFAEDLCGNCDACLRACPTGALYAPRRLDPRRCVTALLTSRQPPEERWPAMGTCILGCDACLEACPLNRAVAPKPAVESLLPEGIGRHPPLRRLLRMDERTFQRDLIGPIQDKVTGHRLVGRLLRLRPVQRAVSRLTRTFFKGRELLPETFVHASGNREVYQRNALIAAGNLGDRSMLDDVRAHRADPYLAPYAAWAERRLNA